MSRYDPETIAHAAARGITEDELPFIADGCSGGLTRLYALGGRAISCEGCCNRHDIDYQLGGSGADRAAADERLRRCAAAAGYFPPGWKGAVRRVWRRFRARVMWLAVRALGWSFWADNPVRVSAIRARIAARTALAALTAIDGPKLRADPLKGTPMADIIDQAQDQEARERDAAISAARAALDGPGPHWIGETPFCRECGEIIPLLRVKAMPGSPHCVECAARAEYGR